LPAVGLEAGIVGAVDLDDRQVAARVGQLVGLPQARRIEHPAPGLERPAADPAPDPACRRHGGPPALIAPLANVDPRSSQDVPAGLGWAAADRDRERAARCGAALRRTLLPLRLGLVAGC